MRRFILPLLGALLALPASGALAQGAAPALCRVPPEFRDYGGTLPRVAQALSEKRLTLLVLGSASGQGNAGNSSPETSWPHRFVAQIEQRVPGLDVTLILKAKRGNGTAEQAEALRQVLSTEKVDLVIWQTGTVEAVTGADPQAMAEALEAGIAAARQAGTDIVLMDQQFSRFLRANSQIDTYRDKMRLIAAGNGVPLLRRYDLMQLWADQDGLDLERTIRGKLAETADKVHDCLGRALALMVLRTSGALPPNR
ncbi:SGNH/GDSL hydrolase family protein [Acetobacteraceae bacterium H6797]|nr:SGNH/GDSL hydrolase family protein [Acetobacteraceae bacterium H6797]